MKDAREAEIERVRGQELMCEQCGCTRWACLTGFDGSCCDGCEHPSSETVQLADGEREQLLRAWPWPQEAATTADGFEQVVMVVRTIIAHRLREHRAELREAWDRGHRFTGYAPGRGENPYGDVTTPPGEHGARD